MIWPDGSFDMDQSNRVKTYSVTCNVLQHAINILLRCLVTYTDEAYRFTD